MVQLAENGNTLELVAGRNKNRPSQIEPGSGPWQRWAIQTIRLFTSNGQFRGRNVTAAIPPAELFIDNIRISRSNDDRLQDAAFSRIKQKLPFEPVRQALMIKCLRTADENVLVMAAERKTIERHLAIYEQANLRIKTMGVWPLALVRCYTRFFGGRKSDLQAIVMLVSIEQDRTNLVVCRHKQLLFARSIPIGAKQLADTNVITRFVVELTACRRQFCAMHHNARIERLLFLTGRAVEKDTCAAIAKQLEMPAQMGDCLAAVRIANPRKLDIERRAGPSEQETAPDKRLLNWSTAFGLSLSS